MKCFVASALGHKDVDKIYTRAIRPVLREFKIAALRIDRVEHNDDIDNKIFALLDSADFCIADLTFARPSAYYEAGYAFGSKKPVIYTARKDHFRPRADDDHGNFRVHFDLQMKNIIQWTDANEEFKGRLRRRLRVVLAPLLKAQEIDGARRREEEQFRRMSVNDQVVRLASEAKRLIDDRGYRRLTEKEAIKPPESGPLYDYSYIKVRNGVRRKIRLVASVRVPGRIFSPNTRWGGPLVHFLEPLSGGLGGPSIKRTETLILLVGLHSPAEATIRSNLAHWTPLGNKVFRSVHTPRFSSDPPSETVVSVLDGAKSVSGFSARVSTVLDEWEGGRLA